MPRATILILILATLTVWLGACEASQTKPEPANAVEVGSADDADTTKTQPLDLAALEPPKLPAEVSSIEGALASFPSPADRVTLTSDQWQSALTEEEFEILREAGTERAFTGDLLKTKGSGIYTCAGCGAPLFSSQTKYESGTGWPSFYEPIQRGRVGERDDDKYGMSRTEVVCERCGGHLGHVFEDGPDPTGLRYCINSASLDFVEVAAE